MHLAQAALRRLTTLTVVSALTIALSGLAHAGDRVPLVGSQPQTLNGTSSVNPVQGAIISIDPTLVPCQGLVNFADLKGGATPGTNYDGAVVSGGMIFAERFVGQPLSYSGNFDVVTGTPSNPLTPQVGAAGQNLDIFDYSGNVLTGLGPLGYPDIDAIGEGAISMLFPIPQSVVKMDLVGGNGGSATLSFYRADGSLIDDVVVSGLADLTYAFATADASVSIAGILIQNSDASGMGVVNICYDPGAVPTHVATWGSLKELYR